MKFLVTGASGFLGTHLTETLSNHGHEIVALCRDISGHFAANMVVARGDVLDAASVGRAAKGCPRVHEVVDDDAISSGNVPDEVSGLVVAPTVDDGERGSEPFGVCTGAFDTRSVG